MLVNPPQSRIDIQIGNGLRLYTIWGQLRVAHVEFCPPTVFMEFPSRDWSKYMAIMGLWVEPPFRRRGLATKMIQRGISAARELFLIDHFALGVEVNNYTAQKLYSKLGFRVVPGVQPINCHMLMELVPD